MNSILYKIAIGFLEKIADKLFVWAYSLYKIKAEVSANNKDTDAKTKKYQAIVKEINDQGNKPTDAQRRRLIDAARNIIRDGRV